MSPAIDQYPGELSIEELPGGGYVLKIDGPGIEGTVTTGRLDHLEKIAEAYGQLRREDSPQQREEQVPR